MLKYNPKIVTDELVFYLDAANIKSYPRDASIWYDLSGKGNNGTLSGPSFNSSNNGGFVFNGTSNYVSFSTDSNFPSSTSARTFSVWIKTPSSYPLSTNTPTFFNYGKQTFNNAMFFGWEGRSGTNLRQYSLFVSNWGNTVYNNTPLSLDTIYNAVVTKLVDSEYYTFYLNGLSDGTNTWLGDNYKVTNTILNNYFMISKLLTYTEYYWKGNIYCIKIYNKALSSSEVLQNFNALKSRYGL